MEQDEMAQFMLLLRGGNDSLEDYSPEDFQQLIQPYIEWSNAFREQERHRGGNELATGGKTLRLRDGSYVVDGPYAETKEDIGGYFLIEAANENEAVEIAKGCPVFAHGGFVEVRQIVEH